MITKLPMVFLNRFSNPFRRSHDRLMPFLAIALVLGLMLRMYAPGSKAYQHDETITALRISGHTEREFIQDLVHNPGMTLGDIQQRYQVHTPSRPIGFTLDGLAQEEPQLTPLYYGLVHYWAGLFGSDRGTVRLLSIMFSGLAIGPLLWLGWELFGSWQAPMIAVGLFALSPFHTLMAQQARHYSLWSLTTLLCSAALLRALRRDRPIDWLGYSLGLALSLYTGLLTVLVAAAHGLYVVLQSWSQSQDKPQDKPQDKLQDKPQDKPQRHSRPKPWSQLGRYLLASIGAGLLFSPWAIILFQNWSRVRQATGVVVLGTQIKRQIAPWSKLIEGWLRFPGRLFYDANVWSGSSDEVRMSQMVMLTFCLCLLAYSGYRLWRSYDRRTSLFLLTLAIVPWVGLIIQDRVLGVRGGEGSTTLMYLTPTMLAIGLIVSSALAYHLRPQAHPGAVRLIGQIGLAILLSAGLFSNILIAQTDWWVNQGFPVKVQKELAVAALINKSDRPLLISDPESWEVLFFSHLIKPDTPVIMNARCGLCNLPDQPGWIPELTDRDHTIFAFPNPSSELKNTLQTHFDATLDPLLARDVEPYVYRLTPEITRSPAPIVTPTVKPADKLMGKSLDRRDIISER
jgi:uncharacterized membrane protein